jgi:hypothetical protein
MTLQEKQQLKARFFGIHLGCKCFYGINDGDNDTLLGVDLSESIVSTSDSIERVEHSDKNFKLILRPLSSITDEEAIEIGKMLGYTVTETRPAFVAKAKGKSFCEFLEGGELMRAGVAVFEIHDYLRSRNFALPFMGLAPVAENWCILEEINQPQG